MNKIKTISSILIIFLINSFATASETKEVEKTPKTNETTTKEIVKNGFGYASLGVKPWIFPNFNLGYRMQNNHFGLDSSAGISAIHFDYPILTLNLTPLFYPNPTLKGSQSYFGLGAAAGVVFEDWDHHNTGVYFGPSFVFGREFLINKTSRQFFQFSIDALFNINILGHKPVAAFSFAYGWGF